MEETMKKLIAIVMLLGILMSTAVSVYAADGEKVNAMLNAISGNENVLASLSKHTTANMWDGNRGYNGNVTASYCDFKLKDSAADILAEDVVKYNIDFAEGKEDSIYYHVFEVIWDQVYTVDTFSIFLQTATSTANIDGFDIWLSETGKDGSFKKVVSVTELYCGQKYEIYNEDGLDTVMYTTEFEPAKAQYMRFGLSQLRCRHEDALKLLSADLTPNANPHYFRISEIEMMGTPVPGTGTTAVDTTAAAPVTTPAPVETTAPAPAETTKAAPAETTKAAPADTTTAKDPSSKGGCGGSLSLVWLIPVMICSAAVVVRRKHN